MKEKKENSKYKAFYNTNDQTYEKNQCHEKQKGGGNILNKIKRHYSPNAMCKPQLDLGKTAYRHFRNK